MLTLIDGRLATLPGLGLPQFMLAPNPASDLAAVEIVVGPAAALYGPNAHAGVVNMLTKNPFDYAGADLSVRGGTQSLYDINLRYADYVGNFGWKITGQWMDANQFESGNIFMFVPPTYIGQNQTLLNPETPTPLRISRATLDNFFNLGYAYRETEVSAMRAGLRKLDGGLYYRTDNVDLRFMAGLSSSTGFIGSNFGVLEANDYQIQYQSLQGNGSFDKLGWFFQVTRTANDAGKSFQLHDRAEWFAREAIRLRSQPGGATLTVSNCFRKCAATLLIPPLRPLTSLNSGTLNCNCATTLAGLKLLAASSIASTIRKPVTSQTTLISCWLMSQISLLLTLRQLKLAATFNSTSGFLTTNCASRLPLALTTTPTTIHNLALK